MHPLVLTVWCGLPGSINSGLMPSLSHQTESSASRDSAFEAKGVPLSAANRLWQVILFKEPEEGRLGASSFG
jgi:hypothetical protein